MYIRNARVRIILSHLIKRFFYFKLCILSLARRLDEHATLQPAVFARELSDEVLHVSRSILAAAILRCRGRVRQDCRLCFGKNVSLEF